MGTGQASRDWSSRRIALESSRLCDKCVERHRCVYPGTEFQCTDLNIQTGLAHPSDPRSLDRLGRLGTLHLDVIALPQPHPHLPRFIPLVEPRGVGRLVRERFVAVSLKDAFDESGSTRKALSLRRRLGVNSNSFVLLLCFGRDPLLVRAFDTLESTVRGIAGGQFDLVTAVGLSQYRSDPPLENLINIRESLESFHQLQAHGVTAVPFVAFSNECDVARWATWLIDNPSVRMVALDFQDARHRPDWRFVLGGFRELVDKSPDDIQFLIRGPSSGERIRQLFAITRRLTIINAQPFMKATKGASLEERRRRQSKTSLFAGWSRFYKGICKAASTSWGSATANGG